MLYHSQDTYHVNLTEPYESSSRKGGGDFFWRFINGEIWRLEACIVLLFPLLSSVGCLLNLEPSRQHNKRSCKCLNRGLLDFGVPTSPRPQVDWVSLLPQSSFTPRSKCLKTSRDFCASRPCCFWHLGGSNFTSVGWGRQWRTLKKEEGPVKSSSLSAFLVSPLSLMTLWRLWFAAKGEEFQFWAEKKARFHF